MDFLHEEGVKFVHLLQSRLLTDKALVDKFVEAPQYFADPDTLMAFVFPLMLAFNKWLACRFALTIGLVDMVNTVLKWILQGDRPYWWVPEANASNAFTSLPQLEQHPLTCEAGPGSPSGHAMTSAAIGFVLVSVVVEQYIQKWAEWKRTAVESLMWFGYVTVVSMISVARLRLATHFPHQVVLGAGAGLAGGWLVWNLPVEKYKRKHFVTVALAFFLWAVGTYFGVLLMGIDPNRTVQLALKHCVDQGYVKLTTTPWHSVYRNWSLLMATGLCVTSKIWSESILPLRLNALQKAAIVGASFFLVDRLVKIPYPHQPAHVFYLCTIFKNCMIVFVCLLAVPWLVAYVSQSLPGQKNFQAVARKKSTITAMPQG